MMRYFPLLFLLLFAVALPAQKPIPDKTGSGEELQFYGLVNNCIPFRINLVQNVDSISGSWQIKGEEKHYLRGIISDEVIQLIEQDEEGDPTGYLFFHVDEPRAYAHWVNNKRTQLRLLALTTEEQQIEKNVISCVEAIEEISLKQIDLHTYAGTIYNNASGNFSTFTLRDSLYLQTYSSMIPKAHSYTFDHRISKNIRKCLKSKEKSTTEVLTICDREANSFLKIDIPENLLHIEDLIRAKIAAINDRSTAGEAIEKERFEYFEGADLIPFYVDKKIASFLVLAYHNKDIRPYTLNWSVSKGKVIENGDVFKSRFDLNSFLSDKVTKVKSNLRRTYPGKTALIDDMDFSQFLISNNGLIFVGGLEDEWHSFYVPYEEFDKQFLRFHPLRKIIRNGNK